MFALLYRLFAPPGRPPIRTAPAPAPEPEPLPPELLAVEARAEAAIARARRFLSESCNEPASRVRQIPRR